MQDLTDILGPLIPALRRYARVLLRDPAAADDLVQDGLEHALSRWHQRRGDGSPRAWLFSILHNLAVSSLRQRQRRGPHIPWEEADAAGIPAPQDGALDHRDLLAAVDDLPPDQRSVLLLVAVEGLSYAEVARALDIPVGTVMSRLSRGRARLRDRLQDHLNDVVTPTTVWPSLRRVE